MYKLSYSNVKKKYIYFRFLIQISWWYAVVSSWMCSCDPWHNSRSCWLAVGLRQTCISVQNSYRWSSAQSNDGRSREILFQHLNAWSVYCLSFVWVKWVNLNLKIKNHSSMYTFFFSMCIFCFIEWSSVFVHRG